MRLIDGDGINLYLVERGQSDKRFKWGETIRYTPSEVQQIINDDIPAVDAVPVVRCKDCKHRPVDGSFDSDAGHRRINAPLDEDGDDDEVCPCICEDGWYSWRPQDNFFCAYGEKKEGNE